MAIYEIEMDPEVQDPRGWSGSDVLRSIPSLEGADYLVDMDPEVADTVQGLLGIRKFELASDGQHSDDNGRTFHVRGGGDRRLIDGSRTLLTTTLQEAHSGDAGGAGPWSRGMGAGLSPCFAVKLFIAPPLVAAYGGSIASSLARDTGRH